MINVKKFLPRVIIVKLPESSPVGKQSHGSPQPSSTTQWSWTTGNPSSRFWVKTVVAQTLYPAEIFFKNKNAIGDFRI